MSDKDKLRILCVDDEPVILRLLVRILEPHFRVFSADRPEAGLQTFESEGPFAVVVSDLKMPGMDGIAMLSRMRETAPDTVRMLLTGHADVDAAVAAINDGQIFRFLNKPCPPDQFLKAVRAVEQHRLTVAGRILLEETLRGSVKALTDILALVNPAAFGRASRVKRHLSELLDRLGRSDRWEVEVAAMLSQIGSITLPSPVAEKLYLGHPLSEPEADMAGRMSEVSAQLVAGIPRLEGVCEIIAHQDLRFDPDEPAAEGPRGTALPWGARALKILIDYDVLESQGMSPEKAGATMRERAGWYDPEILEAFAPSSAPPSKRRPGEDLQKLTPGKLRPGMIFAADVQTVHGLMIIARGQVATESILLRIRNFALRVGVKVPIPVLVPPELDEVAAAGAPELKRAANA